MQLPTQLDLSNIKRRVQLACFKLDSEKNENLKNLKKKTDKKQAQKIEHNVSKAVNKTEKE